jgi:sulfite oxidase
MVFSPVNGAEVSVSSTGKLAVGGVTFGQGGCPIVKVEVSIDEGKSWMEAAQVDQHVDDSVGKHGWSRWMVDLEAPAGQKALSIWSRATDASGRMQEENPKKQRGYTFNGYSKIDVTVV